MIDDLANAIIAWGLWLVGFLAIGRSPEIDSWIVPVEAVGVAVLSGALLLLGWRAAVARRRTVAADTASLWRESIGAGIRLAAVLIVAAVACAVAAPVIVIAGAAAEPLAHALAWIAVAGVIAVGGRILLATLDQALLVLHQIATRSEGIWDDLLVDLGGRVARSALLFGCVYLALTSLVFTDRAKPVVDQLLTLGIIGLIGWLFASLVGLGDRYLQHRFRMDVPDNLQARRVFTQLTVLRRLAYLAIGIVVVSLALMQFDGVRRIGTSILASAGLAGVIVGFAAQRTLANVLAGLQVALTQPIRMDDVVVMEGEWGRIEEITLTYVVVAIWDGRRLIVPLTRIIETPFQNWTRTGSNLLGSALLRCDFATPIDELRAFAKTLVEADPRWDKRVFAVQVTDCSERSIEVRVLVSANDSGKLFDLRCALREALLAWVRGHQPLAFPLTRIQGDALPAEPQQKIGT